MTRRSFDWRVLLAAAITVLVAGGGAAQGVGYLSIPEVTTSDLSAASVGPALAQPAHVDEALVVSFSHEMAWNPITGVGEHEGIVVVKPVSRSSPLLASAMNDGTPLSDVELRLYRDENGVSTHYYTLSLDNVYVVAIAPRLAGDGLTPGGVPTHLESVLLLYGQITWHHVLADTTASWNQSPAARAKVKP